MNPNIHTNEAIAVAAFAFEHGVEKKNTVIIALAALICRQCGLEATAEVYEDAAGRIAPTQAKPVEGNS